MITPKQILGRMSYSDQLHTQEWKRFADGIKEQRNFCECCKRGKVPIQVHHLFYEPDRMLWEYESAEVIVLCAECHKELHVELKNFREYVFRYLTPRLFRMLNGCLAVGLEKYEPMVYMHALAEFTGNERLIENHAKAYGFDTAKSVKQL